MRAPATTRLWPSGVSSRYCGPTSKSAAFARPRSAFCWAAVTRFGRIEGRITSRSALMGLMRASSALPPPNSSACAFGRNEKVTASMRPRAASDRRTITARFWAALRAGFGSGVSRVSGTTGISS